MVSDSISSPLRGAFHLSLTVLVHYRSGEVFSLTHVVRVDSHEVSPASCYLRKIQRVMIPFAYRTITVFGLPFQGCSAREILILSLLLFYRTA